LWSQRDCSQKKVWLIYPVVTVRDTTPKNRSQSPLRGDCCLLSTSLLLTSSKDRARSVSETFFLSSTPSLLGLK